MTTEDARRLAPADTRALLELCRAAGWNQTEEDWLRMLSLEPDGCFGIEIEGRLVATATAICYGNRLAWIGMVLTHADYRGRGLGSRITARAVEHARDRGVAVIKLDATDMGRPLYLRLGFSDESPIERWSRQAGDSARPAPGPLSVKPFGYDAALDLRAFGADRSRLLALIGQEGFSCPGGFVAARMGSRALHIGPCVARSPAAARKLLSAVLSRHPAELAYWDVLPANSAAVGLAADLGFARVRSLTRMALGGGEPDVAHDDSLVYATAGFEYG